MSFGARHGVRGAIGSLLLATLLACGGGGGGGAGGAGDSEVGYLRATDSMPDVVLILASGHTLATPVRAYLADPCDAGPWLADRIVQSTGKRVRTLSYRDARTKLSVSGVDVFGTDGLEADLAFLRDSWPAVRVCAVAHSHGGVRLHAALAAVPGARVHHEVCLDTNSHLFDSIADADTGAPVHDVAAIFRQDAPACPGVGATPSDDPAPEGFDAHRMDVEDVVPWSVGTSLEVRLVAGGCLDFDSWFCPLDNHWNVRADGTLHGLARALTADTHGSIHLPPPGTAACQEAGAALALHVAPWLIEQIRRPLPDGTFGARMERDLGAGRLPRSLATADLDEDGRTDLVVGTSGTGLLWLPGVASGLPIGAPVPLPGPTGTDCIATSDFDRDGDVDLVASSSDASALTVIYGDGGGGVSATVSFASLAFHPIRLECVDLDGDGDADILALGDTSIWWTRNGGDGTWAPFTTLGTLPGSDFLGFVAEDLDHDRVCDLVIGRVDSAAPIGRVTFVRGVPSMTPGGGTTFAFGAARDLAVESGMQPTSLLCLSPGSLDANRELIVNAGAGGRVQALRLTSAAFVAATASGPGGIADFGDALAAADLDGDGRADLCVGGDAGFTVYPGGTDGVAAAAGTTRTERRADLLTLADFDGDGFVDLAFGQADSSRLSIVRGQGRDHPGLSATPSAIVLGIGSSLLAWSCPAAAVLTDDDPASIDVGAVAPTGSRSVAPDRTTVYTITCGGQSVSVQVSVGGAVIVEQSR